LSGLNNQLPFGLLVFRFVVLPAHLRFQEIGADGHGVVCRWKDGARGLSAWAATWNCSTLAM